MASIARRARRLSRGVGLVVGVAISIAGRAGFAGTARLTVVDGPAESAAAIRQALRLLPRRPRHVSVIGEENVRADSRVRFRRAEAFVSSGRPIVYITRHSPALKAAQEGSPADVHALAAIIWHELAHLEGADEAQAQRREEALWTRFVRDGAVDRTIALRYLSALRRRRP